MFKGYFIKSNSQSRFKGYFIKYKFHKCTRDTLLNTNSQKMFQGYFIKYNPKEPMEDCGYIAVF